MVVKMIDSEILLCIQVRCMHCVTLLWGVKMGYQFSSVSPRVSHGLKGRVVLVCQQASDVAVPSIRVILRVLLPKVSNCFSISNNDEGTGS
jgi:hypothetical protein